MQEAGAAGREVTAARRLRPLAPDHDVGMTVEVRDHRSGIELVVVDPVRARVELRIGWSGDLDVAERAAVRVEDVEVAVPGGLDDLELPVSAQAVEDRR